MPEMVIGKVVGINDAWNTTPEIRIIIDLASTYSL